MPNYSNGKIYKLQCEDGYFYIGSTIQVLSQRLGTHKKQCKTETSRIYQHINEIGWDKVRIVLIENVCCNNREELVKKEDEYIRQNRDDAFCLNMRVAFQTEEQKRDYQIEKARRRWDENKENMKKVNAEYYKTYYQQNKEKIKERSKKYREKKSNVPSDKEE